MILGQGARHAGLIQGLISPSGILLWLSGVLPGSAHDITAAREQALPAARPYLKTSQFRPTAATKASALASTSR